MSHPSLHARNHPGKAAIIMAGTGETISYGELDCRSNQAAHLYRSLGLGHGDTIAICMDNRAVFFDLVWGAQRAGLVYVAISSRLTASEIDYILADSGAQIIFAADYLGDILDALVQPIPRYLSGAARAGWQPLEDALAAMPMTAIGDERAGTDMLYSSGTTGQPKGVRLALPADPDISAEIALTRIAAGAFGFSADSIYLSPAPLYHAAPLRWCMSVHRLGGTVVVMEKFDPVAALAAIQSFGVTDSQWVPTHFVRMLKLPEDCARSF